ncbi:uncharacterized protein TNCV_1995161 [Trichonephila clavipes]|nr:uncharacterized protein TNCV_1995161 [Trichonephila clavipes]
MPIQLCDYKNRYNSKLICFVEQSCISVHSVGERFTAIMQHKSIIKGLVKPVVRDEAHFWLNGYVNKQNCRIWSEANPQVYVETPLHPEKLIVWCALWAGGIIGPHFFKND